LCQDNNDYVQNIANSDDETKKNFKRTAKHGPTQYAMSETSYKPADEETSNSVNIVKFTPQQQQNKTPEQLFLHVSNFMKDKIEILAKKAQKKNTNQKDIKLLNSANEAAACLVELVNKERDDTNTWKKKQSIKKRNMKMTVVKRNMSKKKNRCQKKLGQKKMKV
jgi:hypothetical protein